MAHVFYVEHNSVHAKLITEKLLYEPDIKEMTNLVVSGPLHVHDSRIMINTSNSARKIINIWKKWMTLPSPRTTQVHVYQCDTVKLTIQAIVALFYLEWNHLKDHCDKYGMLSFSCLLLTKVCYY